MRNIAAKYIGLTAGLLIIIMSLIVVYGLKKTINNAFFGSLAIYATAIAFSLITFAKNNSTEKTFKDYFSRGFKTFIVVTLLMTIFIMVFYIANPQLKDAFIAENNAAILKQGQHTVAELPDQEKTLRSIFIPMMTAITLFEYLFLGALTTAIISGFLSQKKTL